jgi:hypothetical protein
VTIAAIVLAVIAAAGVYVSPESASWADSGDVMFYLGSAESFAHGGGVRSPMGPWEGSAADSLTVPAHYPPGFSIAIGTVMRLGASRERAARIVRAVSLGLTVGMVTALVGVIAGIGAGVIGGILVMISPMVVFTHTIIFSEPLFTVFMVATIALMVLRPRQPLAYGATAALALGVRLIGVAITGAATLWAIAQPGTMRARASRAAQAFVPSVIAESAWIAYIVANRGGDQRKFGWYGPAIPLFRKLLGVNLWWFWPTPGAMTGVWIEATKAIMVVAFVAIVVSAWRLGATPAKRLLGVLALIFVLYNLVYITDRLVMDWPNNFEIRNFSVVDVMLAMALAASVGVTWPRHRGVITAGLVAWLGAAALGSGTFLRDGARESASWADEVQASPLLGWVRGDTQHREIYTNWNARVWRATDRRTRTLPLLYNADTIALFGAKMAQTRGVLIGFAARRPVFSLTPEQMASYAAPDTIAAVLHLPVLVRSAEGTVWGPPPR